MYDKFVYRHIIMFQVIRLRKKPVAIPFYCDVTEYNYRGGISKCSLMLYIFINQDPSNPSTIYTALDFAWPVTFDEPLYIKAAEIVA